jgi:hypothetical protein
MGITLLSCIAAVKVVGKASWQDCKTTCAGEGLALINAKSEAVNNGAACGEIWAGSCCEGQKWCRTSLKYQELLQREMYRKIALIHRKIALTHSLLYPDYICCSFPRA